MIRIKVNISREVRDVSIGFFCYVFFFIDMSKREFILGVFDWISERFLEDMVFGLFVEGFIGIS